MVLLKYDERMMSSPEMTNVQILTIAIALGTSFLAVLVGVLLNNTRLNDVKELLGAKIDALGAKVDAASASVKDAKETLRAEARAQHAETLTAIAEMIDHRR